MSIFSTILGVAGKANPLGLVTSVVGSVIKRRNNRSNAAEEGYLAGLKQVKAPKSILQGILDIILYATVAWPLILWPLGFFFQKQMWITLSEDYVVHIANLPAEYFYLFMTVISVIWIGQAAVKWKK